MRIEPRRVARCARDPLLHNVTSKPLHAIKSCRGFCIWSPASFFNRGTFGNYFPISSGRASQNLPELSWSSMGTCIYVKMRLSPCVTWPSTTRGVGAAAHAHPPPSSGTSTATDRAPCTPAARPRRSRRSTSGRRPVPPPRTPPGPRASQRTILLAAPQPWPPRP